MLLTALLASIAAIGSGASGAGDGEPEAKFSFCVLGHLRGDKTGEQLQNLDEVIADVKLLNPDLVFLCGDLIWGDIDATISDSATIEKDWEALDAKLATLGVPVYRTAGNHDVNDIVTRQVWVKRYGDLPKSVEFKGSKFILLKSVWWPEDSSTEKHPQRYIRGKDLDDAQVAQLSTELADPSKYEHAFVFTHALLWWDENASWWFKVHPLLVKGKVQDVFGGDYGPMKFSHLERSGVDYYQTSIENKVSLEMLRTRELSRILSSQFDNFLYVTVDGPAVRVEVRVVGATSTGKFTPQHFENVNEYDKGTFGRKLAIKFNTPEKLEHAFALAIAAGFASGAFVAVAIALFLRRRAVS